MKKHHYWMIGVIVLEILFLGITNDYQYQKEVSAARLIEQKDDACQNNPFAIPIDSNYFVKVIINKAISNTVLKGNVSYKGLNLAFKDLKKVPRNLAELIGEIDCINRISLSQNYINEFPEAIIDFPNAKKIDLSYNRLQSLDFKDKNIEFDQVEELTLSGNPMAKVNENITKFPNLVKLYLENMPNLEDISEEIKQLEKLKIIVIRDSPIGSNRNKIIRLNKWLNKNQIRVYWKSRRN